MTVVCVIPAFNEDAAVAGVVEGILALGDVVPLVVDDASRDGTAAAARDAGATVVTLAENRGYEGALDAGFAEAARLGAEVVVTLDADGQLDPGLARAALDEMTATGADLVIGVRDERARPGERLFGWYGRLRFGVPDLLCGLKAYRMTLYHAHGRFDGTRMIGAELAIAALKAGARAVTIPVPVRARVAGGSRIGAGLRVDLRILGALWRAFWLRPLRRTGAGPEAAG